MSVVTTQEIFLACFYTFALGAMVWVAYHLLRGVVVVIADIIPGILSIATSDSSISTKEACRATLKRLKYTHRNHAVYNCIYILAVSIIYSVYSFVLLDGAFRVLPLISMCASFSILSIVVPKKLLTKISHLPHYLSLVIILPSLLLIRFFRLIYDFLNKIVAFGRKNAKNSPAISKNTK